MAESYEAWCRAVKAVLSNRRPGTTFGSISPSDLQQGFAQGVSPVSFVEHLPPPTQRVGAGYEPARQAISEHQWAAEVETLLRRYRPNVPLIDIDPTGLYAAYAAGMSPAEFASQADLPWRPGSVSGKMASQGFPPHQQPPITVAPSQSFGGFPSHSFGSAQHSSQPWLAFLLSLIVPGVGQMYVGQTTKGLAVLLLFFGSVALSMSEGQPFWIFVVLGAAIDALLISSRLARGEHVDEWRTF